MTKKLFVPVALVITLVTALVLRSIVGSRTGTETFMCESGVCTMDSALASALNGVTLLGPFIVLLGFVWSRRQHKKGRLGPFANRTIQDGEEIFEVFLVLAAGIFTYWYIRNGPSIEAVDIGAPNTWAQSIKDFRREDGVPATDLVPTGRAWFIIGTALVSPFALAFGTLLGREFYGIFRRRDQRTEDREAAETRSGSTAIDLREQSTNLESGDNKGIDLNHQEDSIDFDS